MNLREKLTGIANIMLFSAFCQTGPGSNSTGTNLGEATRLIRSDSSKVTVKIDLQGQDRAHKAIRLDSLIRSARSAGDDTNKVNILIAICLEMQSSYPPANTLVYAFQTKQLCETLLSTTAFKDSENLKKRYARSFNILGILHGLKGDVDRGIYYFSEALKIRESIHDKSGMANSYNNLGAAHATLGQLFTAAEYHLKSLKMVEELKDSAAIGYSLFNLSHLNMSTKNYDRALRYGLRSLHIRQNINDVIGIGESLTSLGIIYSSNENYAKALEYGLKGLALNESLGARAEIGNGLNNIAGIYLNTQKFDLGLKYYQEALEVYKMLGDSVDMARTIANIGRTYYLLNKYTTSKELLLSNIGNLKKYGQMDVLEGTYNYLSKSDSALGNFRDALLYQKLYAKTVNENMQTQRLSQLEELQIKYETEKKERDNLALKQQNRIQALALSRSRYVMFLLIGLLFFASLTILLIVRQNKLKAERKALQLEQKLLRVQMNPHFIYNSLQAIQNYILKHDEKESLRYLSSFASLTRDVLENSRFETIPLKKEIALLNNYLQLQKLRFGNRFDFEIHLAPGIDPKTILIPPMLSQPFIENAIEHGLNDIECGGKIDVYFTLKDKTLLMEIVDNGKGMSADNQQSKNHASLAMQITEERISLLNRKTQNKTTMRVSKAFENESERRGVRIEFSIPLQGST